MVHHLPNLNDRPWVRNRHIQHLFSLFENAGAELRFVGGAVRNALLSRPVYEIDMAVNIPPDQVMKIGEEAGVQTVATGLEHGTVTFIMGQEPVRRVEVTSLRADIKTDGRHAQVAYTSDWAQDASRRDFTMNALYCARSGEIFDPLSAYPDVQQERVVFIDDPEERVREDFLRILRFFRFSAQYGDGKLDKAGLAACEKLQTGLEALSRERVGYEFLRLLIAQHPLPVLQAMADTGIYGRILPGRYDPIHLKGVMAFETAFGFAPDPVRRLAALLLPEALKGRFEVKSVQQHLALSSKQRDMIAHIWALSRDLPAALNREDIKKYLYLWGGDHFYTMMSLIYAHTGKHDGQMWLLILRDLLQVVRPVFPLRGDDLINKGFSPGPALGAELKRLETYWVAQDFSLNRDQLLALAHTSAT